MKISLGSLSKSLLLAVTMGSTVLAGWAQPTSREQSVMDAIAQVTVTHILIQGLVRVCGANLDAQVPQELLNTAKGAAMGRLKIFRRARGLKGHKALTSWSFQKRAICISRCKSRLRKCRSTRPLTWRAA